MGFSRQECWSGLPFPSPGDFPDPGIEPGSPTLQADALPSKPPVWWRWSFIYLVSLVQLCCREGGTLQTNISGMCGECLQYLGHTGFALAHSVCAFPVYTAQAPGCSVGELSKACPGLHALPRSKLLRFRFSGTPQRHRLSGVCVLCPSQVLAAQVTRCLVSVLFLGGAVHLITSQSLLLSFPGA